MIDDYSPCCRCNRLAYYNPGPRTASIDGSYICPTCELPFRHDAKRIAELAQENKELRDAMLAMIERDAR